MTYLWLSRIMLPLTILCVIGIGFASAVGQRFPKAGELILSLPTQSRIRDLYLLDLRFNNLYNLTRNMISQHLPQWSADGNQFLYLSDVCNDDGCANTSQIFISPFPNINSQRVSPHLNMTYREPQWSPNGQNLVYNGLDDELVPHLFILNLDTLTEQKIMDEITSPQWSADGLSIYGMAIQRMIYRVYQYDTIAQTQQVTIEWEDTELAPNFSRLAPDGSAFFSVYVPYPQTRHEVFLINANDTEAENLSQHEARDSNASWSPDAQEIAFLSQRTGHNNIFSVHRYTGKITQWTSLDDGVFPPLVWSPDGQHVLFEYLDGDTLRLCIAQRGSPTIHCPLRLPQSQQWDVAWRP